MKLEKGGDRTDNRILVFTPHRLFVMTAKVGAANLTSYPPTLAHVLVSANLSSYPHSAYPLICQP